MCALPSDSRADGIPHRAKSYAPGAPLNSPHQSDAPATRRDTCEALGSDLEGLAIAMGGNIKQEKPHDIARRRTIRPATPRLADQSIDGVNDSSIPPSADCGSMEPGGHQTTVPASRRRLNPEVETPPALLTIKPGRCPLKCASQSARPPSLVFPTDVPRPSRNRDAEAH